MWSGIPKLPKVTSLGAFNFYVFIKWPKFGPLFHPCFHLLDFGGTLPPSPLLRTFKTLCQTCPRPLPKPPITKILNSVIFILFHNQWLESALINARKNYLLIWSFPMFPWIQFHNHQLQSALINTKKNVLLMCHRKIHLAWIICNFASNMKQI